MSRSSRPEILAKAAKERRSSIKKLAFPTKPLPHSMLLTFRKYDYERVYNKQKYNKRTANDGAAVALEQTVVIELPFPSNLTDETSLRLENYEQSAVVEGLSSALSGLNKGDSLTGTMMDALSAGATGIQKTSAAAFSSEGRKDIAAVLSHLTSIFGKNDFSQSIENTIGLTANPKETFSFSGVDLKSHSFSWKLHPSNRNDTETLNQITRTIKSNILPSTREVIGIEKMFLSYPSTCEIQLIGVDQEFFMKFKPAFVKSFNVSYGSGEGVPLMTGGRPAVITFDLVLQELEADDASMYGEVKSIVPADQDPKE